MKCYSHIVHYSVWVYNISFQICFVSKLYGKWGGSIKTYIKTRGTDAFKNYFIPNLTKTLLEESIRLHHCRWNDGA